MCVRCGLTHVAVLYTTCWLLFASLALCHVHGLMQSQAQLSNTTTCCFLLRPPCAFHDCCRHCACCCCCCLCPTLCVQDNLIRGRFLAELTREVFGDLEQSKYQHAEMRISVYGRKQVRGAGLWQGEPICVYLRKKVCVVLSGTAWEVCGRLGAISVLVLSGGGGVELHVSKGAHQ